VKRVQRVAAYCLCLDGDDRLLMCRLSAITGNAGKWTLPGGGVEHGEHPEQAAIRELREETGYVGVVRELLTVDSARRETHDDAGEPLDYHAIRFVYRTDIADIGPVVHELEGSTDRAEWFTREQLAGLPLVPLGALGVHLAYSDRGLLT